MRTYLAFSTMNRAYICEADSKKQMKHKGMNMRLQWNSVKDFKTAKIKILHEGYNLTNATKLD